MCRAHIHREVQECTDQILAKTLPGPAVETGRRRRTATPLHAATACSCARCPPVSRLREAARAPILALRPVLPSPAALTVRDLGKQAAATLFTVRQPLTLPAAPRPPLVERKAGGAGTDDAAGWWATSVAFQACCTPCVGCESLGSAGHACPFRRQTVTAKQRAREDTTRPARQDEMHTDRPPAAALVQQRRKRLSWISFFSRRHDFVGGLDFYRFESCGLLSQVDRILGSNTHQWFPRCEHGGMIPGHSPTRSQRSARQRGPRASGLS